MKKLFFVSIFLLAVLTIASVAGAQNSLILGVPVNIGGGGGTIVPGVNIGDLAYWDGAAWQPAGSAFNLENSNGSLVLSGGSLANPAIDFDNAGTGFKSGGPGLLQVMRLGSNEITLNPFAWGYAQGGGGIMLQTPSSTVPGLSPYWADPDTGMGWASDQIFLIVGGVPNLDVTATDVTTGSGAAGVDYTLTFDGEDSDGTITWLEDESTFAFDSPGQFTSTTGQQLELAYNATRKIALNTDINGYLTVSDSDASIDLLRVWSQSGTRMRLYGDSAGAVYTDIYSTPLGDLLLTTPANGSVRFESGTLLNPSIAFSDADSGVFEPTDDEIGIGILGTEVTRFSEAQVTVKTNFDAESLNISSVITPPALSGHTHNWNPTGLATARIIRVSSTANYELTGINATGLDYRRLTIINEGSFNVKVMSEDLNSTAEYRFIHSGDETMVPYEALELWYDPTLSRWLIIAH